MVDKIEIKTENQTKTITELVERIAGLEKALLQLNETYNKHIADLHVKRIG